MNSDTDLKAALTEILENNGVLSSLRANLRSEILKAVEEPVRDAPPKLPEQNCLINELVLEYLVFNNYKRTASMLGAESGYQQSHVGRAFLEKELQITMSEEASQLPLLYSILETLRSSGKCETSSKSKKGQPEMSSLKLRLK
uniref:FGFR1 oncogene partner (FOP) N-terminal dimerisation domain-containing protein n=1 Tax=Amblyomma cajennense TaxID=34607 RepID=A0A023FN67_AMBCJ